MQEAKIEETHAKEWVTKLAIEPESVWALWKLSLRLEMLCTQLEEGNDAVLRGPNLEMMEKSKIMGGEVTDEFLIGFLTHLVTRTEVGFALFYITFSLLHYPFPVANPPETRPP